MTQTYKLSVEEICKNYERFMGIKNKDCLEIPIGIVSELNPTKHQIEEFSKTLLKYKDLRDFETYTASYLTALINSSKDKKFILDMQGILLDNLGNKLEKELIVKGDARDLAGIYMKNGNMTIEGNVRNNAGIFMNGGNMTIEGDAGDCVGFYMFNGKIVIKGNVGNNVGCKMKGGEIHLYGGYGSLADKKYKGKIYHRGKLIWSGR